ncbi:MAG: DoxX family protein [Planctomycetes bacterium]|nr:DoxX family protein [Planctomycetota bacterium]
MESTRTNIPSSIGLLALRLGAGAWLLTHGYPKFQKVLAGEFDQFGDPIGLGTGLSLFLIMFAEFFCTIFVALGIGARLFAFPIVFGMCVAAFVAHGDDPWSKREPSLMFAIVYFALIFTGAGRFSLDNLLGIDGRLCKLVGIGRKNYASEKGHL